MVSQSLRDLPVVRDSPAARAYGSLFALLFASLALEFVIVRGVDTVSMLVPDVFDPQIAGAVVYALLGIVAVGAVYGVLRARRPARARVERHDVVQLGGVTAMLLLVAAYLLHGAADVPVFPGDVLTSVLRAGLAMGLLAFAYARACGFDVRYEFPNREAVPLGGAAVALASITGVGVFVISTAPDDPLLSSGVLGQFGPRLSAELLAWRVLIPGVCSGIGMGLLYNGAVQERLRGRLGPVDATAAVTPLVGVLGWAFVAGGVANSAGAVAVALAAVALLSLLAAAIAVQGVRLVARRLDADVTPVVAASVGVAVVAVPLAGLAVVDRSAAGIAVGGVTVTVVAAVASVAYERSRSVWLPVLAFGSYQVFGNTELLLALVAFLR